MLVGRDQLLDELDGIVARLRVDLGASLVIVGETGLGKSALLQYVESRANPVRVLRTIGVRAESALPFAGLHSLLGPVMKFMANIPARQADALSAGFALLPATAVEEFAVGAGALNLLVAARSDGPLLVLVDNFDLLDETSRQALLFVARRAPVERIGMVIATSAVDGEIGLPCRYLGPLDASASRCLLAAASPGPVAPEVADELVRVCGGVPMALVEAASALASKYLTGAEPLPDPLPVGPEVRRAFTAQLSVLDAAARTALVVAAAAGEAGLGATLAAMEALGMRPEALEAAEAADVIAVAGDRVVFRHPLVRAVAYHEATLAQRLAIRRALARAIPAVPSVERQQPPSLLQELTAQEQRVMMLVGHGATNREAANALFLSIKTIEFHLRSVYRKLGVRSRAELAHLVGQTGDRRAPSVPHRYADRPFRGNARAAG